MNPKTNVRSHSRRGTKGVKRHSRKVDSPDSNSVPHDSIEESEEDKEEEKELEIPFTTEEI